MTQAPATDANTPLHLLKPDYPVPYGPITAAQVTEVLERVRGYLEADTPARLVDSATGQPITDLAKPDANAVFEPGAFRMISYEWGVTYTGMLLAAEATGDPRVPRLRGPAPEARRRRWPPTSGRTRVPNGPAPLGAGAALARRCRFDVRGDDQGARAPASRRTCGR